MSKRAYSPLTLTEARKVMATERHVFPFCLQDGRPLSVRIRNNRETLDMIQMAYIGVYDGRGNFVSRINPYPTAFPYGNGMVLHFYQQQESSTTKNVHKVINKRLKTYV